MSHKYASTQVNLEPLAARKFYRLAKGIPDEHLAGDGRSDDPHVTVQYGVIPDTPEDLLDALQDLGLSGRLVFGPSRVFPPTEHSDDAAVVYLPVVKGAEHLRKVRNTIRSQVEVVDNFPNYTPHLTVAYVQPEFAELYADGGLDPGDLSTGISEVVFSSREGKRTVISLGAQSGKRAAMSKSLPVTGYDAANEISKRLRVKRTAASEPRWMTSGQLMVPGNQLWKRRGEKTAADEADMIGPPEPESGVGPFEDEVPVTPLDSRSRSLPHSIAGGLSALTGGRPVAPGWPGGPLYGAAVKGLLGAGVGAGLAALRSPGDAKRRKRWATLGGLGGMALGIPAIAARIYNNKQGVPEAQGPALGLLHSTNPPYLKSSGLIDRDRSERYSTALATYMLERDRNLLQMPYTQAVLAGAVQDASNGGLIGSFTAGDLVTSLVRGGVYAGVAVPVAKAMGTVFGLSAPVQNGLVQLGVLGSLAKGLGSVIGEE